MGSACTAKEQQQVSKLKTETWEELVPMTPMRPGYEATRHNYITVNSDKVVTHLRLNYFPDGGLARLRVFSIVDIDFSNRTGELIDLMSIHNGTVCLSYTDAHYGKPNNLIKPTKSRSMADGWETARRLDRPAVLQTDEKGNLKTTGCESAVFQLGTNGKVEAVVIDTNHFKGNFPERIQVEGALAINGENVEMAKWNPIVMDYKVRH